MAKLLPQHPNLIGGFAPIQMECAAPDLIVDGEVPRDLNGTFYRNGPNPQFAPRGQHHWFGGDGMVHAFTVGDGRVSYRNRWARTVKCKNCRATIPLLKTCWLAKKGDNRVRLLMQPNASKNGVAFAIESDVPAGGGNNAQRREIQHSPRI